MTDTNTGGNEQEPVARPQTPAHDEAAAPQSTPAAPATVSRS